MEWIFMLILLLHFNPCSGKAAVENLGSSNTLDSGQTLQLKCNPDNATQYQWFFQPVGGFSGLIDDENNQILNKVVGRSDSGHYNCQINGSQTTLSDTVVITVNYLEITQLVLNPTTPKEGDNVTLTCTVNTNLNAVTYTFVKDGNQLQSTASSMYSFNPIFKNNTGSYNCTAKAGSLQESSSIEVTVQDLFPKPTLAFTGSHDSGSQSNLSCSVSSLLSPIQYIFSKGQIDLTSYKNEVDYPFTNLRTTDDGSYTCTVKINNIEKTSDPYNLEVKLKVSLNVNPMKEGEDQTITCVVAGQETVNVEWMINGSKDDAVTEVSYGIIDVKRSSNSNNYSCKAVSENNKVSNVASSTLNVYWFDTPIINIDDQYPEIGGNIAFTCSVDANPQPTTFKWYRDGQLINGQTGTTYTLNSVTSGNSGNYKCGTNTAKFSSEKVSAEQTVTVLYLDQPTITFLEGTNTPVNVGNNIVLNCTTASYYTGLSLKYSWTNSNGVVASSPIFRLNNIKRTDDDTYKCTVTGDAHEKKLEKEVTQNIIVYYPPGDLIFTNNQFETGVGQVFSIECYSNDYGNPKVELSWVNDSSSQTLNNGKSGNPVDLLISSTKRSHTGPYTCKGTNQAGSSSKTLNLTITEVPDAPENLLTGSQTSTYIIFEWSPPLFDGNKPITTYQFYYRLKGDATFTSINTQNQVTYNLTGLQPGKFYEVKVQAVNSIGNGIESTVLEVSTGESPPSAPKGLNAEPLSKAVIVKWEVPNPTNGNITGYRVCYIRDTDDGKKVSGKRTCVDVGMELEYKANNLGKYSGYNFSVSAQNSMGYGRNTTLVQILTRAEEPTEVQNVQITPSARSFFVTWDKPTNIYGILQGYNVSYKNSSGLLELSCQNVFKTECTVNGLNPFRDYTVTITVKNHLFSKTFEKNGKTLGIAPPPLNTNLPVPPEDNIEKNSFSIKIVPFDDSNGHIAHYDVIVFEVSNEQVPSKDPQTYTNDEIKNNVVARLTTLDKDQVFTIGNGVTSKRKRRNLGTPKNPELNKDTHYAVFVRGYVYDDVYTTTGWYKVVKTDSEDGVDAGVIIGVVIAIVAVLVIIILVVFFVKRHKDRKSMTPDDTQLKRSMKKSFRGFSPPIQDPTIPVLVDRLEDHVNRLKANGNYGFSQEYQMISRDLDYPYSHTRLPDNHNKNRYHNIPSYDETRVILNIIDGEKTTDYINANYIEGFDSDREYIATQGPLPETVFDFWRMTWETETTTVVMLTRVEEKGRDKCAQYWPDSGSLSLKDIVITATEVCEFPDHVVRTFHLTRTGQAIERIVKQFHFTAWPDFGVPDDPSALLGFLRKVNNWKGISSGPVIVHCSAGVGRTGTYITIDTQIKNIKHKKDITIFSNVQAIRQQRCLMVQTEDQYVFIHLALLDYLESGDTEVEASELRDYFKKQCQVDVRTGLTGIVEEFIRLAKADRKEKFNEANKEVNQDKNRYKNVYPYDSTRVKLSNRPGVDGSDYINANYIDSYASKDMFIATQGPLENTVGDFWRMIWEQNCATVVMLVKEVEGNQTRSHPYWPQLNSSKIEHFIVELVTVTTYGDYIVRDLKLTNTEVSTSRDVKQFQYKTWPDTGSPESGVGIIEMIGRVQKWNAPSNKIITVHCSAGVGRTGVFIALTNLIERVKTESVVDVYQTVKKMRQQRTAMVQTRDQYEFLFRALQEYLDSFDLYANFK